jgi:hypothetical protein
MVDMFTFPLVYCPSKTPRKARLLKFGRMWYFVGPGAATVPCGSCQDTQYPVWPAPGVSGEPDTMLERPPQSPHQQILFFLLWHYIGTGLENIIRNRNLVEGVEGEAKGD